MSHRLVISPPSTEGNMNGNSYLADRLVPSFDLEPVTPASSLPLDLPLRDARDAFERVYFEHHLGLESSNMSRVAERVGLERTHLYRKLKQLGIRVSKSHDEPAEQ